MISPESLPANQAFAPESQMVEPLRKKLDLLRDCADLQGTFPDNVELKFIYWTHGDSMDDNTPEKARLLAPYCVEADLIGFEVAITAHDNAEDVQKEYDLINDMLAGKYDDKTIDEIYGDLKITTSLSAATALSIELWDVGRMRPVQYFPFDVFKKEEQPEAQSEQPDLSDIAYVSAEVEIMRLRESTVLRQLQERAVALAADGKHHQIAIIYGAYHTAASVAARELGAPVSREFISKPLIFLLNSEARELRYKTVNDLSVTHEELKQADFMAFMVSLYAEKLGVIESKESYDLEQRLKVHRLLLRVIYKSLSATDYVAYAESLTKLLSYSLNEENATFFKRYTAKKAAKRLIKLSEKVSKDSAV